MTDVAFDPLATPTCPDDLVPMEASGDVREIATDGVAVVEGTAYWRCPLCGLARLG
ncbi:hypothetical protein [Amnibacterium sp.]|uniref:hypothetical protein n=1 Tax=Amnibacterium sp. TaxID=1872496 RepID=UPI003F7B491B